MKINKSSLNEAIYELIDLPDNAAIVDLGCRNAGYLNGIISEFPGKVTKAIGVDVTDRNFGVIPCSAPVELKIMNCACTAKVFSGVIKSTPFTSPHNTGFIIFLK